VGLKGKGDDVRGRSSMVNNIQKIKVHECAIPFMEPNSSRIELSRIQLESNTPRIESNAECIR
jgi:hypothetical protein